MSKTDLRKMLDLSEQEIFDIALRDTKVPSARNGFCLYRSEEGNHCAVGKVMLAVLGSDTHEAFAFEGSAHELVERFFGQYDIYGEFYSTLTKEQSIKARMLDSLQQIHDNVALNHNPKKFRPEYVNRMHTFAVERGLRFKQELV